jgi:hypothetical protein
MTMASLPCEWTQVLIRKSRAINALCFWAKFYKGCLCGILAWSLSVSNGWSCREHYNNPSWDLIALLFDKSCLIDTKRWQTPIFIKTLISSRQSPKHYCETWRMTYVQSLPIYIYDMYWGHFLTNSYLPGTFLNEITDYLSSRVRRARKHDLEFHPVFPDRLKVWPVPWMGKSRSDVASHILYNEWELISFPQGRNHWRRLVRVPEKAGNFLTSWETTSF